MDSLADLPINVVDLGVAVVLLLSAGLAFVRGFVKEVLGVAGWVGAAFATLYLLPLVEPLAKQYIPMPAPVPKITAAVATFLVALVLFSFLAHALARRVRDSTLNALDRSLGFLFGLLRGAVVVCIAYLLVEMFLPPAEQPPWLHQARVMPIARTGKNMLCTLVPRKYREQCQSPAAAGTPLPAATESGKESGFLPRVLDKARDSGGETGYKRSPRKQLEQLIRSNQ